MSFDSLTSILLLAFGFGFVVFIHELGHFLAAKWAGVKVEQFAVGFGQAVLAYRKGLGVRVGTSYPEFKRRIKEWLRTNEKADFGVEGEDGEGERELTEMEIARGAKGIGISETEYRLNWIPLGGYVKMLGQDDLDPNNQADDPRAYNRQTIAKRMVIVSAGVVMNVILAAIGFWVLFTIGFRVPPAKVGSMQPGSPFQQAGGQVADPLVTLDGKRQYDDWTKVQLNSALAGSDEPIPVQVERNGQLVSLTVTPRKGGGASKDFVGLGVGPAYELRGVEAKDERKLIEQLGGEDVVRRLVPAQQMLIRPGDEIVEVAGTKIERPDQFVIFDRALQASAGKPVPIRVLRSGGARVDDLAVEPHFAPRFGGDPIHFGGMMPRLRVTSVSAQSSARGRLFPGDVIVAIGVGQAQDTAHHPVFAKFKEKLNAAGKAETPVELTVLRDGQAVQITQLGTMKIDRDNHGLGIGQPIEEKRAVVAEALEGTPAAVARIPAGATITAVAGKQVETWYDVQRVLLETLPAPEEVAKAGGATVAVTYRPEGASADSAGTTTKLTFAEGDVRFIEEHRYTHQLPLREGRTVRRYPPMEAVQMGVVETRDFILQFYLTLRRMVTGEVSAKNLMGPVGIFQAGTSFAERGTDWLIWFLAMISANLAVVNFLPIPIVDGGLFTFLLIEKIKGKPLSPKAMAIAQYVGLALLLGIFLFVTYQDITRWIYS